MKRAGSIFWGVLLYSFAVQLITRTLAGASYPDATMWADQIQFFLNHDPRQFDFYLAYGHPGTTIVGIGSLFHLLFGVSYLQSVAWAMAIIVSLATAASSAACYLLRPRSLWWLSTAFLLVFSRLHLAATPPTSAILPLTVLILVTAWLLWDRERSPRLQPFFWWGCILGLSAATRLDATLMVGSPMCLLVLYRHRSRILLPVVAGAAVAFLVADPFLWFMPVRHLCDLVRKFLIHYNHFVTPSAIGFKELAANTALPVLAILLWLVCRSRLTARLLPAPILDLFAAITVMASGLILSSSYQDIRYFHPLIIAWETFLPLFVLELAAPEGYHGADESSSSHLARKKSLIIVAGFIVVQGAAYLMLYPWT